jgi:hypothetical protein
MIRALTLTALVCLWSACQQGAPGQFPGADPPTQGGDPASDEVSDLVESFRRDLADPAKHDVRPEGQLRRDALMAALNEFATANRELLQARFDASIHALVEGAPPSAPAFTLRVDVVDSTLLEAAAAPVWLVQTIDPDVTSAARQTLTVVLPVAAREQGFSVSELGLWLSFFRLAEPTWRRCGGSGDVLVLCADYGDQDIIVIRFEHTTELPPELPFVGSCWTPRALQWWQRMP